MSFEFNYKIIKNRLLSILAMIMISGQMIECKSYNYTFEPFKVTDKNGKPVQDAKKNFIYKDFDTFRAFCVASDDGKQFSLPAGNNQAAFFYELLALSHFARPNETTNFINNRYIYGQCSKNGEQIDLFSDSDHKNGLATFNSTSPISFIEWNVRDDGAGSINISDAVKNNASFSIQIINPNDEVFANFQNTGSLNNLTFISSGGSKMTANDSAGLNNVYGICNAFNIPTCLDFLHFKAYSTGFLSEISPTCGWSSSWRHNKNANNRGKVIILLKGGVLQNGKPYLDVDISAQYNYMEHDGQCSGIRETSLYQDQRHATDRDLTKPLSDIKVITTDGGKYEFPVPLAQMNLNDFIFYKDGGFIDHGYNKSIEWNC